MSAAGSPPVDDARPGRAEPGAPARRRAMDAVLRPRSVAVIGATEREGSVGAAVMRNLLDAGFAGPIVPVNPRRTRVLSLPAVAHIAEAAAPIDLAVVCTPAASVPGIVRECGEAGVGGLVVISAGFRESGPAGLALEQRTRDELKRFPRMRALGPNCLGLLVPALGLSASFARGGARPGGVALVSQSGALCSAILGWARDEGIGFSYFISTGNMLDIGFADLLDELADRPEATAVVLYVEALTDGERFVAAARRCVARKPVIAYKAGRHAAGARAAATHTGAMAGEDAVYQAAFDETGIIRVDRLDDLLATAELLGRGRRPAGARLGIVTNAGGPGVIATDALIAGGGVLARLSAATAAALDAGLPAHWSHANPVDVIGDAPAERIACAAQAVLDDDGVDAMLVILTPQAMIDTAGAARALTAAASRSAKPVLACWMGGGEMREAIGVLQAAGVPAFETPEQAVGAFLRLAAYASRARSAVAPAAPHGATAGAPGAGGAARGFFEGLGGTLSEADSKSLLSMYGVETVGTSVARTRDDAVAAAGLLGYPVVLKVLSPLITHKTEVGGVALDLRNGEEVAAAFDRIRESLSLHRPSAVFEGVTVQRMLGRERGVELIVGARRDPTFGPVVLVGAGGTAAEVLADRAIGLAPVEPEGAARLLRSLRVAPLLAPFRGRAALDVGAAAGVIAAFSRLITDLGEVREAEANPVLVTPEGAIALDARIVLTAGPGPARCGGSSVEQRGGRG